MNKISGQLNIIKAGLAAWMKREGGSLEIASDPVHLFGILRQNGCRVVIMFLGETKRGDFEESGMVDRNFSLVISTGRTLVLTGDATFAAPGKRPLYDLVDDVRELVRGLKFSTDEECEAGTNDTEQFPDFKSTEPFALPEGWVSDAYQITFSIGTQLNAPE